MYIVLAKMEDEGKFSYAVQGTEENAEVEIVSEADLRYLSVSGLKMQTPKGSAVLLIGDTLVCDVELFVPPDETENEEDDYDIGIDEDEPDPEADEDDPYMSDYDYGNEDDSEGSNEGDNGGSEEEDSEYEDEDGGISFFGLDEDSEYEQESDVSRLYDLLSKKWEDKANGIQRYAIDMQMDGIDNAPKPGEIGHPVDLLKRYYLWYSRRLFDNAQKGGFSGFKKNSAALQRKKQALKDLSNGKLFKYAGFLDTGSKYAGYTCTLGHPLRYMHLAWDIEGGGDVEIAFFGQMYNKSYEEALNSQYCIVFGINCIGDFFQVDEECIKSLRKAQDIAQKDMELLYQMYTEGDEQEIQNSFKLLDKIVSKIGRHDFMQPDASKRILPTSVSSFYLSFRQIGLIPPKSLIQEIRSCLVGWTDGKKYYHNKWTAFLRYPDDIFYDRLKFFVGSANHGVVDRLKASKSHLQSPSYGNNLDSLLIYIYLFFTYEICGYYKYTATAEGFHDEGGSSRSVRDKFEYYYRLSMHNKLKGGDFSLATLQTLVDFERECEEIDANYKDMSHYHEVHTYCKVARHRDGEILQISLTDSQGFSQMSGSLKRIVDSYVATLSSEEECNHVFYLIRFMREVVLADRQMTKNLLRRNSFPNFQELKPYYESRPKECYDFDNLIYAVKQLLKEFDSMFEKLQAHAQDEAQRLLFEYEEAKLREIEEKAAKEADRQRQEEERKQQMSSKLPTTRLEVIEYLKNADLTNIDQKFVWARDNALKTLIKTGKEPSDGQFRYIQPLYEAVTGVAYTGADAAQAPEKVELSSRTDLRDAIQWVQSNKPQASSIAAQLKIDEFQKLCSICASVERYGTISEKQMRWVEKALEIYEESKK